MKKLHPLAAGLLLGLLSGCFTVEKAPAPGGGEHILVSNYGWYLFNSCPLACGNARKDSGWSWAFFRNDVDEEVLLGRLADVAAEQNCDVDGLTLFSNDTVLFSVYNIPIPYLLCYQELQLSGVLHKRRAADPQAETRLREYRKLLDRIPDGGSAR